MEVREWLNTFKSLSQTKLDEYGKKYQHDGAFVQGISNNIIGEIRNCQSNTTEISSIASQLSSFLKSRNQYLSRFCLSLSPALLTIYGESIIAGNVNYELEVLLLLLHNHFVSKAVTCQIPRLSSSSIFHDSVHLSDSLIELKACSMTTSDKINCNPLTSICSGNRTVMVNGIVAAYYDEQSSMFDFQLSQGFEFFSILVKQYHFFILESALNYIIQVLNMVLQSRPTLQLRTKLTLAVCSELADRELWPKAILLCQAVKNLAPSSNDNMGIRHSSVEESTTRGTSGILRRAVTSKSIRHHEWVSSESDFAKSISENQLHEKANEKPSKSVQVEHPKPPKQPKKKNRVNKEIQSQQTMPSAQEILAKPRSYSYTNGDRVPS